MTVWHYLVAVARAGPKSGILENKLMEDRGKYLENAWTEYSESLRSFIRAKLGSNEDTDDILADVFLKLATQVELSNAPHKLPNWLYLVARNAVIDHYRTKRPEVSLPEKLVQENPGPEAISRLSACIIPLIEQLPDAYKVPLMRSEIDGRTQKQVAQELKLSLPAVKSRILRGRKKLRDLMGKRCTLYYDENGQLADFKEEA